MGDLGSGLRLRKPTFRLFVTINRRISVKNTLGRSVIVFCACEGNTCISVAVCVGTAMHRFDLRLVIC